LCASCVWHAGLSCAASLSPHPYRPITDIHPLAAFPASVLAVKHCKYTRHSHLCCHIASCCGCCSHGWESDDPPEDPLDTPGQRKRRLHSRVSRTAVNGAATYITPPASMVPIDSMHSGPDTTLQNGEGPTPGSRTRDGKASSARAKGAHKGILKVRDAAECCLSDLCSWAARSSRVGMSPIAARPDLEKLP
jgi:hypothetical protein